MKARLSFKGKGYKVKHLKSAERRRLDRLIYLLLALVFLNFGWDGYKRKQELKAYYGQSKQYYGIISKGIENTIYRIKHFDIKRK